MKEHLMASPEMRVINGVEFLGELDSTFLTYSSLSTTLGVTEGALNTTTEADKWLRFRLDGAELVVSKIAVKNNISWDNLYARGLVYGTDDNGLYPTGTLTNQLRTINIAGKTYKVRLLKGADTDPSIGGYGYYLEGTHNSEWSRLFYAVISNDPKLAGKYTGPVLASYTEAQLQMRWVNSTQTPGTYNWCQERSGDSGAWRIYRGSLGPSYFTRYTSSLVTADHGWRPCLELIP